MTTPRKTPPAPVAGALVPSMPDDVHNALAMIGGAQFAAQMAIDVWPVALAIFDDFANRESAVQYRVWLERAAENFADVVRALPEKREGLRQEALLFVADLPIDIVSVLAVPDGLNAGTRQWQAAIRKALDHPVITRPARKGAMAEAIEIARYTLPLLATAGIALAIYERGAAVRALRTIGNAAAVACGLKPRTLRHWRDALGAAAGRERIDPVSSC
jgi:hypothetical protein